MVRIKTITIHLDQDTWKEYDEVKNELGITWTGVIADWFKRYKRGEFK